MSDRIKSAFHEILESNDHRDVWRLACELCDLFGCDLVQADFGDTSIDYRLYENLFTNYPMWYHEQYAAEQLWTGDDVEEHAICGQSSPLLFGLEFEKWSANPARQRLNDVCASFGLRLGISFPVKAADPTLSGVVNFGMNGKAEQFESVLTRNSHLMALCANAIHLRLQAILSRRCAESVVADLTTREYDVLSYLSVGLSLGQVAEKLRLAEPTVRFHISGAKRKLGVATTAQAVVAVAKAQVAEGAAGIAEACSESGVEQGAQEIQTGKDSRGD